MNVETPPSNNGRVLVGRRYGEDERYPLRASLFCTIRRDDNITTEDATTHNKDDLSSRRTRRQNVKNTRER